MVKATTSAHAAETSCIVPEVLYTYNGFIRCSGISKTRIREARLQGIDLPKVKVGKRLYIRGADGIEFIENIAAAQSKEALDSHETNCPAGKMRETQTAD